MVGPLSSYPILMNDDEDYARARRVSERPAAAPSNVAAQADVISSPTRTPRETGVAARDYIGGQVDRTTKFVGDVAGGSVDLAKAGVRTATKPLRDLGSAALGFVAGAATGEAQAAPAAVTAQPRAPFNASRNPNDLPRPYGTPVLPVRTGGDVEPPASALPQPSSVGPSRPAAGASGPPDDSVEVIRGVRVSRDSGGLSRPVGLDPGTAQLAAGLKNVGVQPGAETLEGIKTIRGVETDAVQAAALAQTADARLIEANKPQSDTIVVEDPAFPGQARLQQAITGPDGRVTRKDLGVAQYRPLNETQALAEKKVKDAIGNETVENYLIDRKTGRPVDNELFAQGRPKPPADLPPDQQSNFLAAYDEAIKRKLSPEDAYKIAINAVQIR